MARTQMFGQLQRLFELSRAADRMGIDIHEAEGLQAQFLATDEGMTRREVLKRGAIAGAGVSVLGSLALRPGQARAATRTVQPRIAIIGAGISGMTAAMSLKDAGFTNIQVYDANDRVGGRTWTRKNDGFFEAGQWVEWGGELIDTGHKTIFSLCQRFGISLYDMTKNITTGSHDILYFNGGYYPWDTMVKDWEAAGLDAIINHQMQVMPPWPFAYNAVWTDAALAIDNMTLAQWIDKFVPGGRASRLGSFIDVAYNIEFGEETSRQSVGNLLGLLGFSVGNGTAWWVYGKSDEKFKIQGGNQQISLAQADYLGWSNIHLGWRMSSLTNNADGTVTASFDVGGHAQTVTADRVILAIPLGVQKRIKAAGGFKKAGFDAKKLALIDALGFGANNKLQLQFADRFWTKPGPWGNSDGETYGDTGYQEAWTVTNGMPGTTGVMVNYTGGDVARLLNSSPVAFGDTVNSSAVAQSYIKKASQTFLKQIEPVFPGMTSKWTGKAMVSVWALSPNQYGAYSYWAPGYLHQYCTYEKVPMGHIHFAGEHCSQDFQGYIEGGADEGIRAASEIAALYK